MAGTKWQEGPDFFAHYIMLAKLINHTFTIETSYRVMLNVFDYGFTYPEINPLKVRQIVNGNDAIILDPGCNIHSPNNE